MDQKDEFLVVLYKAYDNSALTWEGLNKKNAKALDLPIEVLYLWNIETWFYMESTKFNTIASIQSSC